MRKPYTITKQRERWTDAEHALFVEALREHGRAWRRIEGAWLNLIGNTWRAVCLCSCQPGLKQGGHAYSDSPGPSAEHIGTKTAVQIRSHAQKFFAKLEREQASGNRSTGVCLLRGCRC